jgi:hypothetical protein
VIPGGFDVGRQAAGCWACQLSRIAVGLNATCDQQRQGHWQFATHDGMDKHLIYGFELL